MRSDHANLVTMLAPVMVDVGWSDMLHGCMKSSFLSVSLDNLQSPTLYDLAVSNAVD